MWTAWQRMRPMSWFMCHCHTESYNCTSSCHFYLQSTIVFFFTEIVKFHLAFIFFSVFCCFDLVLLLLPEKNIAGVPMNRPLVVLRVQTTWKSCFRPCGKKATVKKKSKSVVLSKSSSDVYSWGFLIPNGDPWHRSSNTRLINNAPSFTMTASPSMQPRSLVYSSIHLNAHIMMQVQFEPPVELITSEWDFE